LSLAIHRLRNKSNERGLVWFGAFTFAFGVRLLFFAGVFRFAASADPAARQTWI
jgi:hypothetical protein